MKETIWKRLFRGVRRLRQRADWLHFVGPDWADRIMELAITDRLHAKQGRSIARWTLQNEDRHLTVYLKRHYRLPRWRGLLATVWPDAGWSPAVQEWHHLRWANALGMPVPTAVAAGEYIGPWGRLQSFLAVEELFEMLPLHEAIPAAAARMEPTTFRAWKRTLGAEMARLTRALHARRYFHKDLYLCHFYIPRKWTEAIPSWPGQVYLIDLHRISTGWGIIGSPGVSGK
jgi:heptose I phosphotransferase